MLKLSGEGLLLALQEEDLRGSYIFLPAFLLWWKEGRHRSQKSVHLEELEGKVLRGWRSRELLPNAAGGMGSNGAKLDGGQEVWLTLP